MASALQPLFTSGFQMSTESHANQSQASVCSPFSATLTQPPVQWTRRSSIPPIKKSSEIKYHMKTIWLFTRSDLKTIVGPQTFFGLLHALSASALDIHSTSSAVEILSRTPLIIFWVWINLLPFCIGNQRLPQAIKEDAINKPWRALPSRRLSPEAAGRLLVISYLCAFVTSLVTGGIRQCLALVLLGYLYNDCGGANVSPVCRNVLNGFGYVAFGSGAMEIALGKSFGSLTVMSWLAVIALIIASGIQTADMYDQEGDRLLDRKTLPLVIGDAACRYTIAIGVLFWSLFGMWFWESVIVAGVGPLSLAAIIAKRTLTKKAVQQDVTTFKLWNLWLVSIYSLPLINFMLV